MFADLDYQRLACKTLGLIHPVDRESFTGEPKVLLDLGSFKITECPAALDKVITLYLQNLKTRADAVQDAEARKSNEISKSAAKDNASRERHAKLKERTAQLDDMLRKHVVLGFGDFLKFNGHGDAERKRQTGWQETEGAAKVRCFARQELAHAQLKVGFENNRDGYRDYLKHVNQSLYNRLDVEIPVLTPERPRRTHSYIMSTTETGKSELLKAICLNYVQRPDYAGLVVLDPGGDMAPQIARWPEFMGSDRLVYVDPALDSDLAPVLNPFDADLLVDQDRTLLVDQIVAAIGSLIEGKVGGELSVNMEALLYPAIRLLVDLPNTNLRDLQDIMRGEERLIELGRASARREVAEFFCKDFDLPNLKPSRNSIVVKLGNILAKGTLERVLCGRTTIDLEDLLEKRKVVLFNLSKGRLGEAESGALGTLVIALLQTLAMKRERLPQGNRPMTHLVIDECQNFVTGKIKAIIRETRKFGLAVTLAQQELGGEMAPDLQSVVIKTTNVKVAGRSSPDETKKTGDLVGVEASEIARLPLGQFWYKAGPTPPFLLHVRGDRADNNGGVSWEDWGQCLIDQKAQFYRESLTSEDRKLDLNREPNKDIPIGETGYEFE